jgi:carboxylesterase
VSPHVRPGAEAFSFGDGPVGVLLVHGFTGSPASTRPLGEWLAGQGLAVEGVRLPGHGTDVQDLRHRRAAEWVGEAARGLDVISSRCRTVVAFGLSMGGSVVLALAASRSSDVHGIALANPYVFDSRHLLIPVGKRFLRDVPGTPNDIAKPGMDEMAYDRMPVPAIVSMAVMMKGVRAATPVDPTTGHRVRVTGRPRDLDVEPSEDPGEGRIGTNRARPVSQVVPRR